MRPVVALPWWLWLPFMGVAVGVVYGLCVIATMLAGWLLVLAGVWLVGWVLWKCAESGAGAALRARDRRERAYYRNRRLRKKGHL